MYSCVDTYFYVRRSYEYRVYILIQKNFNRGRADTYGEKKQCAYGLSDWFKVRQNQLNDRAEKRMYTLGLFKLK